VVSASSVAEATHAAFVEMLKSVRFEVPAPVGISPAAPAFASPQQRVEPPPQIPMPGLRVR